MISSAVGEENVQNEFISIFENCEVKDLRSLLMNTCSYSMDVDKLWKIRIYELLPVVVIIRP